MPFEKHFDLLCRANDFESAARHCLVICATIDDSRDSEKKSERKKAQFNLAELLLINHIEAFEEEGSPHKLYKEDTKLAHALSNRFLALTRPSPEPSIAVQDNKKRPREDDNNVEDASDLKKFRLK